MLQSAAAAGAAAQCCVSLVSKQGTLNLEMDSPAMVKAWIKELTHVLQRDGRRVTDEAAERAAALAAQGGSHPSPWAHSAAAPIPAGRRLSIMPSAIGGLPRTAHEAAMALGGKRRQSLLHLSTTDTVRMLQDGRRFYRYASGTNGPTREIVTLFYVKDKNGRLARLGTVNGRAVFLRLAAPPCSSAPAPSFCVALGFFFFPFPPQPFSGVVLASACRTRAAR